MKLKSHLRLNRGEERPAGRTRSRLVTLATAATFILGFAGFGLAMTAGPALADPTCQEIAAGSDTIQDVMNQYSVDLTGNLLCSYNATDPVSNAALGTISYVRGPNATQPQTTCTYTRANGSGDGQIALRESINSGTTAAPYGTAAPVGCVDIARSSSSPSGSGAQSTSGALIFIPFAEDAVTGAIGPAAGGTVGGIFGNVTTVATSLTTANMFTLADLKNLYTNCQEVTEGGVTYWPFETGVTQPSGTQRIDLYVPQSGSGTRNFWASTLDFSNSALTPCITATIDQGSMSGQSVEEHDGAAVGTDTDGYMPFSIAQWISQSKHTAGGAIDLDRRYGAVLQDIGGTAPFTGTVPNESMNAAFPVNREVYNVVEGCRVTSSAPLPFTGATCSIDSNLQSMLVGGGSSLCQDALTIINYGFALLPNANEPDACGSTATSLWAYPPPV
jgi:hypothetical protein